MVEKCTSVEKSVKILCNFTKILQKKWNMTKILQNNKKGNKNVTKNKWVIVDNFIVNTKKKDIKK